MAEHLETGDWSTDLVVHRLISEYDKDMMTATFYPMTLNDNVNPWNDINVIVESIPEHCGMRINQKKWSVM